MDPERTDPPDAPAEGLEAGPPRASFGPESSTSEASPDETRAGEEELAEPREPEDAGEPGDADQVVSPAPSARHISTRRGGPGVRIPGYHIEGVIGRGSTGTVYRARQENVDREVALKVLHAELTSRPRMVRRLQREARTTARLAHPHIVSAIDMGRTGDRWWFAMELVDGPSLALRLRQDGRLSEREALRLFIPLCEALVHIWENGVVHRDIKPANILIDRVSGARLADLGLAFADDDPHLTGSEGTLGTPHYISPEQARDPSSVDIRTDIWSFGATLFHAVCGEPPLRGANVAEVLSGVLYGRVPDPEDLEPDLSRGFALVLRKCLSRDFEKRYQTPRELLLDLERVRERRRPKVRVASLEPTANAGPGIGRLVLTVGMLLVLGIGATLLWKRPWERAGEGRSEHPQLTALAEELGEGASPGLWLARLDELRPQLTAGDLARWRELYGEGRLLLEASLAEVLALTEEEFDVALGKGDFVAAGEAIGVDLREALLTGPGLDLDQAGQETRTAIKRLEYRLERDLDTAEQNARAELDRALDEDLLAGVEEQVARSQWRDARERLGLSAGDLPTVLGLDLPDLPAERMARLLDGAEAELRDARDELDRGWSALDDELVRWIELEQRDLEAELSRTLAPIGAGQRMADAFGLELFRRGLTSEQMPPEPAGLARDRLDQAVRDLEEMEGRLAASRAPSSRSTADLLVDWLDREACGEDWRLRRYGRADAFWAGRLDELQGLAATGEESETRERAMVKRQEAALLGALLERALVGLEPLDGLAVELHMAAGVRATGTLGVLAPGVAGGLAFDVTSGSGYELYLAAPRAGLPAAGRLIHHRDVELQAGLDVVAILADPSSVTPAELLTLALFRAREGDEQAALDLVSSGSFGAELEALAGELRRRLERSVRVHGARRTARLRDARGLLATLYLDEADGLERLERDPERALATIRRLRLEFSDLEPVSSAAVRLEEVETALTSPGGKPTLADYEAAFGDGVPRFLDGDRVELRYWFEGTKVPGFQLEDWTPDGLHWVSPADIVDDQDLVGRQAPYLVLRSPMDVTRGELVVEFDFTEPHGVATERLVLASVAGFHLALRTGEGEARSEWAVSTVGPAEALAELRSSPARISGRLLDAGGTYRLRVEVNQQNGRMRALMGSIDPRDDAPEYREVFDRRLASPRGKGGSRGISLRAKESLRLSSIWVLGQR